MKNIVFTVFFAFILAGFTAFGQANQLIKQVDTLQNGSSLLTILLSDGTFVKQYLEVGAVDTNLIFDQILNSFPTTDDGNTDYNEETTNFLGENISALPWDICYNPVLNKFYIYNYCKIMIYNNSTGYFETPITISPYDELNTNLIETMPTKKILYYNNYLYCTSNEGKLVIINCNNNQIEMEYPTNQFSSLYKTDLRLIGNYVYWYYSVFDNDVSSSSVIKKGTGTNFNTSLSLPGIFINDWSFDEFNNVFLATKSGLYKYSSGLTFLSSNLDYQNIINVEYYNSGLVKKIVTRQFSDVDKTMIVFSNDLTFDHTFTSKCNLYYNLVFDASSNAIHYSGYIKDINMYYGKILYNTGTEKFYDDVPSSIQLDAPIAMLISTDIFIGCKDNILKISQNGYQTNYSIDGYCTSLSPGNVNNPIMGTLPLSGDFIKFDAQMGKHVCETGGIIKGVCEKLDKTYFIVSKSNKNGYVLCKQNGAIEKIGLHGYFNPLAITCFNTTEQNDLIVMYEIKSQNVSKLKFARINFSTNEIIPYQFEIDYWSDKINHFIIKGYEKNIFFTIFYPAVCGSIPIVEFYYTNPSIIEYSSDQTVNNCPDFEFDNTKNQLLALDRCYSNIAVYNVSPIDLESEQGLGYGGVIYTPYSLAIDYTNNKVFISSIIDPESNNYLMQLNYTTLAKEGVYVLNYDSPKFTRLFYNKNNDAIYGFSEKFWFKRPWIGFPFDINPLDADLYTYDIHFDTQKNLFYLPSVNNSDQVVATYLLDAGSDQFLESVTTGEKYLFNSIDQNNFSFYSQDKAILYSANSGLASYTKITCPFSRPLRTPWHWLSFPRLQRTGNNPVPAIPVLENTEPMPGNLRFYSNEVGLQQVIIRIEDAWTNVPFDNILSTKGYKLNIQNEGSFLHTMYGSDLNTSTTIPLYVSQNGNPENWIGYFLHQPLMPQVAFQGVWDKLTQIKTQDWTMTKVMVNGLPVWISPSNVGPLHYGDGLIVKVSANCTLYWNENIAPISDSERAQTEFFSYVEYADYTPWYIETDSLTDVKEIGLLAGDVCIGASSVEPGDTLVEVNAYTQSIPPGTPIEIATWSGYKSTSQLQDRFFVTIPKSGIKECRKVYSGEGLPYYYISFSGGQIANPSVAEVPASITSIIPNPCRDFTIIRFRVATDAHIEITISGLNGEVIGIIANGDYNEGVYEVTWNSESTMKKPVENGIYIIRMSVDGIIVSNEKVVLIK